MIRDYTDHAANERTYLAWVRTALAFMAFGIVLERLDLVLGSLPEAAGAGVGLARTAGLVLTLLGALVLAVSTRRYLVFKRIISSPEARDFGASRTDLVLVAVVGVLGVSMLVYVLARASSLAGP